MSRWILVEGGAGGQKKRHSLADGEQVVGSSSESDLCLDHPTVSRRHAVLVPTGDGVEVRDLGSSNGTFVDGTRVVGEPIAEAGGTLCFGTLECRLEALTARDAEAAMEWDAAPSAGPGNAAEPLAAESLAAESLATESLATESLIAPREPATAGNATKENATKKDTGAPQTFSLGSVREFVARALPQIVASLESFHRASAAERDVAATAMVQAAGRSLFQSFPCRVVEVLRVDGPEPALLFRASAETPPEAGAEDDDGDWAESRVDPLLTRVRFAPQLQSRGVEPLLELVTRLVALTQDRPPEAGTTAGTTAGTKAGTTAGTKAAGRQQQLAAELPQPTTVDPGMLRLYEEASRIARGEVSVLIDGETGTGKEVLARFIHRASPRARRPWVAINCAALPEELLEAELFGIEKGVATGVEARSGRFEQADGGTLFLDEIGDMAPSTQAKILRVLQDGEVYRLGARAPRPARARILTATNRDLRALIAAGTFRLDLFHRIADCRLTLPPLRHRRGDLASLAAYFSSRAATGAGVRSRGISRAALDAIEAYEWPGNVRQLERQMTRAALFLEDGELLQTRHLAAEVVGAARDEVGSEGSSLKARLEIVERRILIEVLERNDGNVRAAAAELGIGRTTLYRRLGELSIDT